MLVALVPSDISPIGSGLTEKALPVRAASSSFRNWPTCGKVVGMQPRVCRIALETRMMSPLITYTIVLDSTTSLVS